MLINIVVFFIILATLPYCLWRKIIMFFFIVVES